MSNRPRPCPLVSGKIGTDARLNGYKQGKQDAIGDLQTLSSAADNRLLEALQLLQDVRAVAATMGISMSPELGSLRTPANQFR